MLGAFRLRKLANPRQFNMKALGVAPYLFTPFGVWPCLGAGAMVVVEDAFCSSRSTINQRPAAGAAFLKPVSGPSQSVGCEDQQSKNSKPAGPTAC